MLGQIRHEQLTHAVTDGYHFEPVAPRERMVVQEPVQLLDADLRLARRFVR